MNSLILWALLLDHRRRRRISEGSSSSDNNTSSSDESKTSNNHRSPVPTAERSQPNSISLKSKNIVKQSIPTPDETPQTPVENIDVINLVQERSSAVITPTAANSAITTIFAGKRCKATNNSSKDQHNKRMKSSLPVSETDREGNVNSEADASNAQLSIEDSNNPCTVIITHKSNPKLKLSNKEFQRIKSKLLEEIDESEDFDTNFGFLSSVLENGWIKLTCQNTGTREWVLKTINKLNTSLEMDLMASISIAFPKTFICTINLSAEDIITEDALKRRLAKQNKDLSTEEWTLLHNVKLEDGGESFVYCIDEKSKEHIEAAEKKLFLNFSQIFIDIADDT